MTALTRRITREHSPSVYVCMCVCVCVFVQYLFDGVFLYE